jgi:acyl-coenzyme A synthetase/AMP-(fatty) acid ligase
MITGMIFDWARRTPDKTAVVFDGQPLSYRAFADRIAVARGYFTRQGCVGEGVAVVAVVNLLDFWTLSVALRSLGLTTFAVDPTQGLGLAGMTNVRLVVTDSAANWPDLERASAALGCGFLRVSLDGEAAMGLDAENRPPGGHLLRTSGTTGDFKFVLMNAEIDAVSASSTQAVLGLGQQSLVNVFNFGGWTGVGYRFPAAAWAVGAGVNFRQSGHFHDSLLEPGASHAVLIPSLLAVLLAAPADAFPRNDALQLAVGGGPMSRTQIDQTKARITPRLYNCLGATETGIFAYTALERPEDYRWQTIAPGRVVEIVDERDRPVPTGETGRVRVGAAGWPNFYLHDEAATRAAFAQGFFYPGDLGVIRADGRLALQGRVTEVINVNGHKLSPAPIEARLRDALGVSGVCLVSVRNDDGEEQAHLVIESGTPIPAARLTEALSHERAGFAGVRVHFTPSLPRNAMGKVMRQEVTALAVIAGDRGAS